MFVFIISKIIPQSKFVKIVAQLHMINIFISIGGRERGGGGDFKRFPGNTNV